MKKKGFHLFLSVKIIIICLFLLVTCNRNSTRSSASYTMDRDASYAIGMYMAAQFHIPDVSYDYQAFMEGFRAYQEALETRFSMDEAIDIINNAFMVLEASENERAEAEGQVNIVEGREWLEANARRAEVVSLPSGLQYEVITEGTGSRPEAHDLVRVHYEGTLINGEIFDSSYARGEPAEFPLNAVISGWTEGLQYMSEGSIYMLYIPYDLAYGNRATGTIPAYSTLIFRVELLEILR